MPVTEKQKNPSLIGVFFFSIPMALIGALLGFLLLASISPKPFESMAEYESDLEKNPRQTILDAHYFKGFRSSGDGWVQKRDSLLEGSSPTLVLTSSEINAWIINKFKESKNPFLDEEKSQLIVISGVPHVFIDVDEGIQFSVLLEIIIFGKQFNRLLIGKGGFSKVDSNEFDLSELRLNEAKIPYSEKLYDDLLGTLLESFYSSDEFAVVEKAWEKVDSVELIEGGLRLNLN